MNQTLWNRLVNHFGSLYRDRENGRLLGVCSGLAGVYHLNPLGVRVVAVLLLLYFPVATAVVYLTLGLTLRDATLTNSGTDRERRFWRAGDDDFGVRR